MPAPTKTFDFIEIAQKSGLVTAAQVEELFGSHHPDDPNQCAARLMKADVITAYQAKQLLAGKFRGFFLGTYKILRPIGQGGMGAVYLAEHTSLSRKVAIKVLTAEKAKDKLTLERFQREARAAAALDHPNIVRLHDISQGNGVHFLVMEYVEGNDLHSLMSKTGALHFAQAAQYIAQTAAGLQHAHDKGFIHRDIKPANLMLTKDGSIKILDMGLARSFVNGNDNLTALLAEGDIAGTVDFLSPEQAMNHPLDERSDLYSLGATFYALLTGHPPFNGSTAQKLMQHQLKDPPSLTKKLNGRVPAALSEVLSKMMAKRPSERYQSGSDIIDALGPWLPASSTGNIVQDGFSSTELHRGSKTRITKGKSRKLQLNGFDSTWWKNPKVLIGAGVGLVVLLGGVIAGLVLTGGEKSPPTTPSFTVQLQQAGNGFAAKGSDPGARNNRYSYRVDFGAVPESSEKIDKPEKWIRRSNIGSTALPDGVFINHWNHDVSAEYAVVTRSGSRALRLAQTTGESGTQYDFALGEVLNQLPKGESCKIRLTYSYEGKSYGLAFFEESSLNQKSGTVQLTSTDEAWRTVDLDFTRQETTGTYKFVVRSTNESAGGEFPGSIWIKSVEVLDTQAAIPSVSSGVRTDFANCKPAVMKVNGTAKSERYLKVGDVPLPENVSINHYNTQAQAEYSIANVNGSMALGLKQLNRMGGVQVHFFEENTLGRLAPGTTATVRLTYLFNGKGQGMAAFELLAEPYTKYTETNLPSTNGEWKTLEMVFTRPDEGRTYNLYVNTGIGNVAEGVLYIRSAEILPSGYKSARNTIGPAFWECDFSKVGTGKHTFQDGAYLDGEFQLPDQAFAMCWNRKSVAEFRGRTVGDFTGLFITNLNAETSAQIGTPLRAAELTNGKSYFIRVEYLSENEATGEVVIQTLPDYKRVFNKELPGTKGQWSHVDLEFTKTAATDLSVIVENRSVGEGNTVAVRKFTIHNANPDMGKNGSAR